MTFKPFLIAAGLMLGLSSGAMAQPPGHGHGHGHGPVVDRPLGMGRAPVAERHGRAWNEHRRGYPGCGKARRGDRHHRRDRRCRSYRR